jgi:hypothetical protein
MALLTTTDLRMASMSFAVKRWLTTVPRAMRWPDYPVMFVRYTTGMRRPSLTSQRQTGAPISIRLNRATDQLVAAEAKRTRRSKSAVVSAFTEETARTRRFPGIGFRGDDAARRAWVIGSGLDVWEVVQMLEDFGALERLLAETHLAERQVRLALAYRDAYPDEIADAAAENRLPAQDLKTLFPFIELARTPE